MDDFGGGPGLLFVLVPLFIGVVFLIVFGVIAYGIVKGLGQWSRNNQAPLVTVPASVLTKRGHVSGGSGDSSASTTYYVTFEVQGGERIELRVRGNDYGTLVEGDRGHLSYQGTRYKAFTRTPQDR